MRTPALTTGVAARLNLSWITVVSTVIQDKLSRAATPVVKAGVRMQRMQKALTEMNLQLTTVLSDLSGVDQRRRSMARPYWWLPSFEAFARKQWYPPLSRISRTVVLRSRSGNEHHAVDCGRRAGRRASGRVQRADQRRRSMVDLSADNGGYHCLRANASND